MVIIPNLHPRLSTDQNDALIGCRGETQYRRMRFCFENGICPFCDIDPSLNRILYETLHWRVWEVPQNFTTRTATLAHQILIVAKRHVNHLDEFDYPEHCNLFTVIKWIYHEYPQIREMGGMRFDRFGETAYHNGTVPNHHHQNFWVPNKKSAGWVPLVKDQEEVNRDVDRTKEFKKRYDGNPPQDRFSS